MFIIKSLMDLSWGLKAEIFLHFLLHPSYSIFLGGFIGLFEIINESWNEFSVKKFLKNSKRFFNFSYFISLTFWSQHKFLCLKRNQKL
jgi:hypothetical protein